MAELHTSCQLNSGDDDSSIATDLQTLPTSNVRNVTLSPGFKMNPAPNRNANDPRLMRQFVVELMWLASVNVTGRQQAAKRRRSIIRTLYLNLNLHEDDNPNSDVKHELIYGLICNVNRNALTYLRGDLVVNLRNTLNERNSANEYARRYQFMSILRDLQSPFVLASVLPSQQEESPSDLTCADGEDTHDSNRNRRTLRRAHDVAPARLFDLAALEQQELAAPPTALDGMEQAMSHISLSHNDDNDDHVGLPLSGCDSTATVIRQFLQGDFDALRQIEPGELLNQLAGYPAVLHQLLAMPDEPVIAQEADGRSSKNEARAGNSNDFSQGPTSEQDHDRLA